MGLLESIMLHENVSVYKCDIVIKTKADNNILDVVNQIRGLESVVIVTIVQSDKLDRKKTRAYEYTLIRIKYINTGDQTESIKQIGTDALRNIRGLLGYIPKYDTIIKVDTY